VERKKDYSRLREGGIRSGLQEKKGITACNRKREGGPGVKQARPTSDLEVTKLSNQEGRKTLLDGGKEEIASILTHH